MKEYYRFDPDDAFRFARELGFEAGQKGDELVFKKCPFCGGETKKKEKFAINLKTGQFNCFRASCARKGNMITLAKEFNFSLGTDADEYYSPEPYKWRRFKKPEKKEANSAVVEYMEKRHISKEIVEKYGLQLKNGTTNVLAFPFTDEKGTLKFIKYRNMEFIKGETKGSKEWCEKDCEAILFGMEQCNPENKTLILTEGQIDSLSVIQAGFENAVSVPTGCNGFTWVPHCWNWLCNFEKLIVFGDYENGRITLLTEMLNRFNGQVLHVRESDYLDCKDANEILVKYGREQIVKCISNAEAAIHKKTLWLSDVDPVNPLAIPKLKTGIYKLDRLLVGGIPYGGVAIIAGKRGEGKSILASQIIANALKTGNICFVYSGELTNNMFQMWLDMQLAGPRNIGTAVNSFGDTEYYIKDGVVERIHEWYRKRILIYNNNMVDDEDASLLSVIEDSITQQNVRVVLLDNLMTAIDLDEPNNTDKYERQSAFVKKITKLAVKHGILILLVAHNRKGSGEDTNDNVSGSSDITNLAQVTIGYIKEAKSDQRNLIVSKNRLYGKTNTTGYPITYDPASRRITCEGDNVNVEYGWERIGDDFENVVQEELPFGE